MNALLAAALSAFRKPTPPQNGYLPGEYGSDLTPEQHRQIAALVRQQCDILTRRRMREEAAAYRYAQEIAEAYRWLDLEAAWQECYEAQRETIEGQQRVIDSLLAYIAGLPVPETVLTMDRRAA